MSDATGKTPSSLAVTEKRPRRPGGCVGIFFHLFDWNRRFAKKKLFSRKLLPPARTKPSKRFEGDEKMPKSALHLIPDHSRGAFPNMKKNDKHGYADLDQKHQMRSPGLVARLMGLESMPAVCRDKPKKSSISTVVSDIRDEKLMSDHCEYDGEDFILERGSRPIEPRPQKIQRTGSLERLAVTRFGAQAFPLKGVLSQSRKHRPPKLASPIKSPRFSTSRNASRSSRLIGAATRILEPGLQATNKARSSLTYSSSLHCSFKDAMMTESTTALSAQRSIPVNHDMSRNQSLMGQTSCKNCGTLIHATVYSPSLEEQQCGYPSFASNVDDAPSQIYEDTFPSPRTAITSCNLVKDVMFQRSLDQPMSFPDPDENRKQCKSRPDGYRKPASQDGQALRHTVKPQKDEHLPFAFKQRPQTQSQMPVDRDMIPPRAKFAKNESKRASSAVNAVNQVKDFVALNRNLSGYTRPRGLSKMDDSHLESQQRSYDGRDGSFSPLRTAVQEKGTANANGQALNAGFVSSPHGIERKPRHDVVIAKEKLTAHAMDRAGLESRSVGRGIVSRGKDAKDGDVISFAFNSPLNKRSDTYAGRNGKRKDQNGSTGRNTSLQIKATSDETKSLQNKLPMTRDALGVLLEQKLKELTSQEENELRTECVQPKKSTAMILQELICALTAGQPTCQDSHLDNSDAAYQTEEGMSAALARQLDHLSPGSVLEASFSNDSCVSSSLDDNSGNCQYVDSVDYSNKEAQLVESDADILDSATSFEPEITSREMVASVNRISHMLTNINHSDLHISGDKLVLVLEVITRAELLFGKATVVNSDGMDDYLFLPFVQDEVETLAAAMQLDFHSLGFQRTKQTKQLRRFLFDCAIECFDSKYGRQCNLGYQGCRRLPLSMNSMLLIQEVGRAVRKWTNLAGMICDELIEWEMSCSLGKWTDFDTEAYEAGSEIDHDILEILVEEAVVDLWECNKVCF